MIIGGFDSNAAAWLDWLILEGLMQSCFYVGQSFFSVISAQNRNSQCPSGASVAWEWFVRTLCGDFVLS